MTLVLFGLRVRKYNNIYGHCLGHDNPVNKGIEIVVKLKNESAHPAKNKINELSMGYHVDLVQALEPQTVNKSRLFSVTCDIKEALKHLKSHQINWVCKDQSKFAHCLAHWASR